MLPWVSSRRKPTPTCRPLASVVTFSGSVAMSASMCVPLTPNSRIPSAAASRANPAAAMATRRPAARISSETESFIEWLALEADEDADSRIRFAEHVLADGHLAADEHLVPRPAVACVELSRGLVIDAGVVLVVEQPVGCFEGAAEDALDIQTREGAARSDAVAEHPPIGSPVTDDVTLVGQAVLIDVVNVPTVLPLRELERCGEPLPELRERDAGGQRGVAESEVVQSRRIFAGVLQVDGERQRVADDELRRQGRHLIAEFCGR